MLTNEDAFRAKGPEYTAAFQILALGCEIPPSLEVFEHEMEVRPLHPYRAQGPEAMASSLVQRYHRIKIF